MANTDQFLRLVGDIYEAASNASQWPSVLGSLSRSVNAPIAGLLYHDFADHSGHISAITGADPEGTRLYNTYYHQHDPWVARAQSSGMVRSGSVFVGEQLVPHEAFQRTEYYQDYAFGYDGVRLLAGIILRNGSTFANLSLLRGERLKAFGREELAFVETVMPHLQRAMAIHGRMNELSQLSAAAAATFDQVAFGVVLLDGSARTLLVNKQAAEIFRQNDGLLIRKGSVSAAGAADASFLRASIENASRSARGGVAVIRRPSGKRPYQLLISPLVLRGASLEPHARVVLFITDPERRLQPPADILRACFGLTPAETGVVGQLLAGLSTPEIAAALSLRESTVRQYMKAILTKTGCRSQAALVALLLRSVAVVPSTEGREGCQG